MDDPVQRFQFWFSRRVLNFKIRSAALAASLLVEERLSDFLRKKLRQALAKIADRPGKKNTTKLKIVMATKTQIIYRNRLSPQGAWIWV